MKQMNRPSIILTLSLLLFVLLINLNATLASPSVASTSISLLRQSSSIQILNVVNSTNSTADDATNSTSNNNSTNTNPAASETPTAAPTMNAAAPAMAPFTHEPTKKYEPQDDEEEEEEEKKTAKKAGIAVLVLLGLGLGCYFRDAIVFFVGSVSSCS